MIELGLLSIVIFLLATVIYLQLNNEPEFPEIEVDPEKVRGAVSESWRDLKLDKEIGSLENQVSEIKELHTDLETMMKNPRERGEFGEVKLEALLEDHLPSSMYKIQGEVAGKRPDAYIESAEGKICIDSKFPLDNFKKLMEDGEDKYQNKFRKDVEKQLQEIAKKYVRPENGTSDYAFEFVPSERVYYYLVKEEYSLLNKYTQRGVQVVSPLTLGHKLEIIKGDVKTRQMSEKADDVLEKLQALSTRHEKFEDSWSTLQRHIRRAHNKADEVDKEYRSLKKEFNSVDQLQE